MANEITEFFSTEVLEIVLEMRRLLFLNTSSNLSLNIFEKGISQFGDVDMSIEVWETFRIEEVCEIEEN